MLKAPSPEGKRLEGNRVVAKSAAKSTSPEVGAENMLRADPNLCTNKVFAVKQNAEPLSDALWKEA